MEEGEFNTALITITMLPTLEEDLHRLKMRWADKVNDALQMVCTEETVQAMKGIRADIRKEYQEADEQRKAAKAQYMGPWNTVEATFKDCVKDSYIQVDDILKTAIDKYEGQLKQECYEKISGFFNELVLMEGIDFLTLEQAMKMGGIKISLEDAKKNIPTRLQDLVAKVVAEVATGMDQIRKMDDSAEIMTEFKQCLNVGKAVATVQERKRRIQAEKEAAEQRKALQERFQNVEDKVKAVLPPEEIAVSQQENSADDPIFEEFSFTVYGCTKSQLIKIRNYLKQEGISYG